MSGHSIEVKRLVRVRYRSINQGREGKAHDYSEIIIIVLF